MSTLKPATESHEKHASLVTLASKRKVSKLKKRFNNIDDNSRELPDWLKQDEIDEQKEQNKPLKITDSKTAYDSGFLERPRFESIEAEQKEENNCINTKRESRKSVRFAENQNAKVSDPNNKHNAEPIYINWKHISNCVQHEMYSKLANTMRSTINDKKNKIKMNDVDKISKMIYFLKSKRNLTIEETNYLNKLHERAMKVSIINTDSYEDQKAQEHISIWNIHEKHKGLNQNMLQDIYDVHRQFIFSNHHFSEYSLEQFRDDMMKAADNYLRDAADFVSNHQFKQRMCFYPNYIINDDMFAVMNYVFGVSQYVHYVRNNINNLTVQLVVIPRRVHSVFDDSIVYKYKYGISNIDSYLHKQKVYDFQRCTFRSIETVKNDIITAMKQQYDIKGINSDGVN
eukprot:181436_1